MLNLSITINLSGESRRNLFFLLRFVKTFTHSMSAKAEVAGKAENKNALMTDQPTDKPTNQPTNQPTDQPTNQPTDWPTNQPTIQHTNL